MKSSRPWPPALRPLLHQAAAALVLSLAAFLVPVQVAADDPELPPPATDADFYPENQAKEELGKLLFFDKLLSGNRNISCATCHHPMAATGDGLALPVGEGGEGLGVTRDTGRGHDAIVARVPRNAPHVFNLGAAEFTRMFDDGRVEVMPSHPSGFRSPAGDDLPDGLDNVLAAQAMFPVTSADEMAGQSGENPIADAAAAGHLAGPGGVWNQLAKRIRENPEYVDLFIAAFDDVDEAGDITYVHAANAIAAFEAKVWRADNSPFDRHLRGDEGALSPNQRAGMELFYGSARCADCHSGTFQTDHSFKAIGMPQVGPGKGDDIDGRTGGLHDFGRERVTGEREDRMAFRVPSLRNVAITGPWGHDGAYDDLRLVVMHHMRPRLYLRNYDPEQLVMPSRPDLDEEDLVVMNDGPSVNAIAGEIEIPVVPLPSDQVDLIIEFLQSLTDPVSLDLRENVPQSVPSGLPVRD